MDPEKKSIEISVLNEDAKAKLRETFDELER